MPDAQREPVNFKDAEKLYFCKKLSKRLWTPEDEKSGISIGRAIQGKFSLIYANAAFCEMTGYASEEVIGKNCSFLQNSQSDQPGLKILRAALVQNLDATALLRITARTAARSGMN